MILFKKRIVIPIILIISLILLNHYMSYSMRIGNTSFYLVETMAMSNDGKPLLGLYHKEYGGYKGVEISGFPKNILWNNKYLISKNFDGKDTTITNYIIINLDSVDVSNNVMKGLIILKTATEYNNYLQHNRLSESKMKQIDNRTSWWKALLK